MVREYVQGKANWMAVQNRMEHTRETALVFDESDGRWEPWVDGKMLGSCRSREDATLCIAEELARRAGKR